MPTILKTCRSTKQIRVVSTVWFLLVQIVAQQIYDACRDVNFYYSFNQLVVIHL